VVAREGDQVSLAGPRQDPIRVCMVEIPTR